MNDQSQGNAYSGLKSWEAMYHQRIHSGQAMKTLLYGFRHAFSQVFNQKIYSQAGLENGAFL